MSVTLTIDNITMPVDNFEMSEPEVKPEDFKTLSEVVDCNGDIKIEFEFEANDKWQRATKRFIDSANSASKAFKEFKKQFTHENTKSD